MIDYDKLTYLCERDKKIQLSRDNLPTLKLNDQYIHSIYNVRQESNRMITDIKNLDPQKTLVIVFGCGFGYHIELLEELGFQNIILIERNKVIFQYFKEFYDTKGIKYVIAPEDPPESLDYFFSNLDIYEFQNIKTMVLRGTYNKDLYNSFENRLEKLVKVKLGDFSTRIKFEELWFIHIIKNLLNLSDTALFHSLIGSFDNKPAIIISAGPSLRNSLEWLKVNQDYFYLIAVDTAVLVLYEYNIVPDFIFSLDSQVYNLQDFMMIPKDFLKQSILVYDCVVHHALVNYFPGKKIMTNTAHLDFDQNKQPFVIKNELVNWIETKVGFRIGDVETGGSVSTSAFHFAYLLGFSSLIIIGQDLSYTNYASHAVSTPHYYKIINRMNRYQTIDTQFFNIMQQRKPTTHQGIHNSVKTDFILNNYKNWFEESAKNIKSYNSIIHLINFTNDGIKIKNFEYSDSLDNFKMKHKKNSLMNIFSLNLIDFKKTVKITYQFENMINFLKNIEFKDDFFTSIQNSNYAFLGRYFLKEKIIFERYHTLDKMLLKRKLYRLVKTIEGNSNNEE